MMKAYQLTWWHQRQKKVARLQAISIPRLELMGAVVGTRLAMSVVSALSLEARLLTFWSDSANVLWWIRGHSRIFKPFIANRVEEIHLSSSPDQWRHVPTAVNPADYLTHEIKIEKLVNLKTWGPEYLKEVKKRYMPRSDSDNTCAMLSRCEKVKLENGNDKDTTVWRLQPERFSNWIRLIRLQAWVMRFVNNCRACENKRLMDRELQLEEIDDTEAQIVKTMQKEMIFEEYQALVKKNRLPKHSIFCILTNVPIDLL